MPVNDDARPRDDRIKIGDFVWAVVNGKLMFKQPVRVRELCEKDGQLWGAYLDGSESAVELAGLTLANFVNLPDIPAIRKMKAKRQWVSWKYQQRKKLNGDTYVTKVPVCPNGNYNASVNDPATWGSYEEAVANTLKHGHAGVGYVLCKDDDISGIDLDKVRDAATGALADFAQEIVDLAETYTEVSPSGTGLRLFWLGKLSAALAHKAAQVEVYSTGRYLTVTGDRIAGTPDDIQDAPKSLELLRARVESFKTADAETKAKAEKGKPKKKKTKKADETPTFYRNVNDAALEHLEDWVPELFPSAQFQPGTKAWRVSSYDLCRDLEEDLSLHPNGITDWGLDDIGDAPKAARYTAIDILIEHGGAPDAKQAAFWLCKKMDIDPKALGWGDPDGTIADLNQIYAVLPIGGKTRVVKFGEDEDFPGRETIVMAQSFDDFKDLNNKYRHTWVDEDGEEREIGLGTYWIGSKLRRQYDGGMAFMPQHDGDVGNKLNLWRGFGVQPIKPDGKSGAAGCAKNLKFGRDIICSGNEEQFDYLIKREATILQKRIRTEVALAMRTKEEGVGKGFYEWMMRRLLGNHAMLITKPAHIVGKFNPHLETLLRLTADEALFVGNHEHRNTLFTLITEPELTIEPKGCGVYRARNFLNTTMLSNADHFVPISGTARRFFIPTVSTARMQDFAYFADLKTELENGGFEALLYHLLYEVDLRDFNVRKVPQTDELRRQRNRSLPPLEAWWVELLESGTLWGADPVKPNRAVSNSYPRSIMIGGQNRAVTQQGIYDQARQLEPRLRTYTNDYNLADFLKEQGCSNKEKVLRRRGWTFPALMECREKWVARYLGWVWRDPDITEWRAEESDDKTEDDVPSTDNGGDYPFAGKSPDGLFPQS